MLKIPKMHVRIVMFCGLFSTSFPSVSMEEQSITPTSIVQKIFLTSQHKKAILDLQSPVPTTTLGKQKKSAFGTPALTSLYKRIPQKKQNESQLPQRRSSVSVTEWPTSLFDLSSEDLRYLYGHCSRMIEYEDVMLERNTWTRRLQCVESAQRTLKIPDSKVQPIGVEFSDGCEPYQIRHIYINTKNPSSLDLHGIVSARAAKIKVLQFINAAKSKKKKQVTVITGKGNHVNQRGSRGVLLQSFPKWVGQNPSIVSFSKRGDGGSYMVYLTPPSRIRIDFDPSHDLQQKIFYSEKYEGCCFNKITVSEGNHHFKNNPDSDQESIDPRKSKSSSSKTKKNRGEDRKLYLKDIPSASQMGQPLPKECVTVSIPKRRLLKTTQPLPAQHKTDYTLSRYPEEARAYNDKASRSNPRINHSKTSSLSKKSPSVAIPKVIPVFPTVISHKKAKEYLEQFCQIQQHEPPYYELVSHANLSMKIVAVTIEGLGTYQVETDKKPQQFIAQKVYRRITGVPASKKKAKELLEKICQEKGYGVPAYQTSSREFRVKISVGNLAEEASHTSQDYAAKLAAKKMYELLKNSSKTK